MSTEFWRTLPSPARVPRSAGGLAAWSSSDTESPGPSAAPVTWIGHRMQQAVVGPLPLPLALGRPRHAGQLLPVSWVHSRRAAVRHRWSRTSKYFAPELSSAATLGFTLIGSVTWRLALGGRRQTVSSPAQVWACRQKSGGWSRVPCFCWIAFSLA